AVKSVAEAAPRRRLAVLGAIAGVTVLLVAAFYGPFWRGGAVFAASFDVVFRGRANLAGRELAAADTPVVALAIFTLLLLAAMVVTARTARPRLLELSAVLVTFFVLFALRWRMPWYFMSGLALV